LQIRQEGKVKKVCRPGRARDFQRAYARQKGQPVLYVTERCVFALTDAGLKLVEIAPGVDLERDILARMDFGRSSTVRPFDGCAIFRAEPMG
jgi:propionate CoA-transferase